MVLGEREQEVISARLIGLKIWILQSYLDYFLSYACDCDVGCLGERNLS